RLALQDVVEAAPDILLISPCGYQAKQARDEYRSLAFPDQWNAIPAVRTGRVYALEASSYFARPGPRLITGIETLARLVHPALQVSPEAEEAILPVFSDDPTVARAALA